MFLLDFWLDLLVCLTKIPPVLLYSSLCHSVIPWHQKPIKITDLTHMKLVGVMRPEKRTADYMVPNSVRVRHIYTTIIPHTYS